MNILINTFFILLTLVPATKKAVFIKSEEVKKPERTRIESSIIYKKVPTKWTKITKKSN